MFRVATGTLSASAAGTADFTVSGFGTVAGAIVYINGSTAASNPNSSPSPGWLSTGYFDGTNQIARLIAGDDGNSTTTDTWKYSWSDKIGGYTNNAGTAQAVYSISKIADGVRITTDTADGTAYNCMVVLIPATGVSGIKAFNQDWSGVSPGPGGSAAVVDTSVGFEADLVFGMCGVNPGPGNVDFSYQHGWGWTHNQGGGTIEQVAIGYDSNDGRSLPAQSTYTTLTVVDGFGIANTSNSGFRYGVKLTNFTQDGFTATKYEDFSATTLLTASFATAEDQMYLAIQFTGSPNIKLFAEVAPTSNGSFSATDAGFTPTFGMMMTPDHTPSTINTVDATDASGVGILAFDSTTQHTIGHIDRDNVTTTELTNWSESGLQMYEKAGNSKFTASFTSFDANGWTWNFTDSDPSTADNWVALAIGPADEGVSKKTMRVKQGFLASGATGTADFTIPGIGTIAGAIVYTNRASTTNDPALAEGDTTWICAGFWDGTTQVSHAYHTEDGITNPGTTDSWNSYSSNKIAYWCNNAGTTQFAATISSVTDGVRITTDTSDGEAHRCMVILIPDSIVSNIDAQVIDRSGIDANGIVEVTNVGFEADAVFVLAGRCTAAETTAPDFCHSFGVALNKAGEPNYCMHLYEDDGRDMSTQTTYLSNISNEVHCAMINSNSGLRWGLQIKSFDAQGFTTRAWNEYVNPLTTNDTNPEDILVLAIKFQGIANFDCYMASAPITTGDWAETDPGFQPSFGLVFGTEGVVDITSGDASNAESFSVMPFDGTNMYSFGYNSGDNLATVTTSAYSLTGWRQVEDNGVPGTDDTFVGTFKSFDANGFTMNFSAVPGSVDKWPVFTLGEFAGVVITDVDGDEAWDDGSTGLVITGTGFV